MTDSKTGHDATGVLTYLMATDDMSAEDAEAFDLFLRGLARIMEDGPEERERDSLLVFHRGDNPVLARLQRFAKHHRAHIIEVDSPVRALGDLLQLGVQMAKTQYTLPLTSTDHLIPNALKALRGQLIRQAPDLCLTQSAWGLADPEDPLPRNDAERFKTLPSRPGPDGGTGLLPDPRRLIFRSQAWSGRAAEWPTGLDGHALYERVLTDCTDLLVMPDTALLHRIQPVDPAPVLDNLHHSLEALAEPDRAAFLAGRAPLLDEMIQLCPPDGTTTILKALAPIAALLPLEPQSSTSPAQGAFAGLLAAQIKDGEIGAKAELALLLTGAQQRRGEALARAYGRLRRDLDLALPGPDYLRALYTRLRGL